MTHRSPSKRATRRRRPASNWELTEVCEPNRNYQIEDAGAHVAGPARWMRLHEKLRAAADIQPRVPDALQATLRPYQEAGFAWLMRLTTWAPGAVLADDMGLGKTVQVLAMLPEPLEVVVLLPDEGAVRAVVRDFFARYKLVKPNLSLRFLEAPLPVPNRRLRTDDLWAKVKPCPKVREQRHRVACR